MWFLFVRPEFCLHLLSDSTSQWTPLVFSYAFPATRAGYGLSPIRIRPCRAHYKKAGRFICQPWGNPFVSKISCGKSRVVIIQAVPMAVPITCKGLYCFPAFSPFMDLVPISAGYLCQFLIADFCIFKLLHFYFSLSFQPFGCSLFFSFCPLYAWLGKMSHKKIF